MCASPRWSRLPQATRTGYVYACQRGTCQLSSDSRMYFRLACVSVKLQVRLPAFLGPAGRCLCLMTCVCRSSLRACPSPSACCVSRGTPRVSVHVPGYPARAVCCLSVSNMPQSSTCVTATATRVSQPSVCLSVSDTGSCPSGLCERLSDTVPLPETSAWVRLAVSLSRTLQQCSCVSQ